MPRALASDALACREPQSEAIGPLLHDLEVMDGRRLFDDRRQCERDQAHDAAIGFAEGHDIVGATLDLDRRERASASTGLGFHDDAVAEVVANDRLNPVGEIRHRPERAVVVAAFEADPAERCITRLDPDPEPELGSVLSPLVGQLASVSAAETGRLLD